MNKIDLTVNKLGEFLVPDSRQNADNQCGKKGNHTYKYKVSITGVLEDLNKKGFLLDNKVIEDYFIETYMKEKKVTNSCELMACAAIEFIQGYCKEHKIGSLKRCYVQIWGSDSSFIEAEWNKEYQ